MYGKEERERLNFLLESLHGLPSLSKILASNVFSLAPMLNYDEPTNWGSKGTGIVGAIKHTFAYILMLLVNNWLLKFEILLDE